MEVCAIRIGGGIEVGLLFESLPTREADLKALGMILVIHNIVADLFDFPELSRIIIIVRSLSGPEGENRLPVVEEWIENYLNPAMPKDWQACFANFSDPVLCHLRSSEGRPIYLFFLSARAKEEMEIIIERNINIH